MGVRKLPFSAEYVRVHVLKYVWLRSLLRVIKKSHPESDLHSTKESNHYEPRVQLIHLFLPLEILVRSSISSGFRVETAYLFDTEKQFPFMYFQKRFSQAPLLISTQYFQSRIITLCLELQYSVEKYGTQCSYSV